MSGLSDSHQIDQGTSLYGSVGVRREATMSASGGGTVRSETFYEPDDMDMARMMWGQTYAIHNGEVDDGAF